jgi:hypothetical protein
MYTMRVRSCWFLAAVQEFLTAHTNRSGTTTQDQDVTEPPYKLLGGLFGGREGQSINDGAFRRSDAVCDRLEVILRGNRETSGEK